MDQRIKGTTKLYALFGSPVGHSGSPAMYNFSFWNDGIDSAFMAFDVREDGMEKAVDAIRTLNIAGGNFTMPVKNIASKLVDRLSPAAEMVGACNTFVNEDGVITGHITDGLGFVMNLKEHGIDVRDKRVVILGAGGAATAIQVQLALEGAKEIIIFNRNDPFFARAEETKEKILSNIKGCEVSVLPIEDQELLKEKISSADIVVNSTTVGMKPHDDKTLVDRKLFRKGLVVCDTVYNPAITRMLKEAEEEGCITVPGTGMLLCQGMANYRLFTGHEMPVEEFKKFRDENNK